MMVTCVSGPPVLLGKTGSTSLGLGIGWSTPRVQAWSNRPFAKTGPRWSIRSPLTIVISAWTNHTAGSGPMPQAEISPTEFASIHWKMTSVFVMMQSVAAVTSEGHGG